MTAGSLADRPSSRHLLAPDLVEGLEAFPEFDLNDEFLAAMRELPADAASFSAPPLSPELEAVERRELHVPGPDGAPDVRILLYLPGDAAPSPRPVLLHIHGGGYVMGAPDMNDPSNRARVLEHGCVVASVDYRLAPETRWPGSLEDCYAVLRWLNEEADALDIDRTRIAVSGESAGAGHAAALAQLAVRRGEFSICFQLLDSPMLDDRTGNSTDPHPYTGEFVWTAERNHYGWSALLGCEAGSADVPVEAVPARAADLSGLPATFVSVGSLDLFLEESLEYVRRLSRAGVPVELHVLPGAYHGYQVTGDTAATTITSARLSRDALARAFQAG